jgi:hypothetical protein
MTGSLTRRLSLAAGALAALLASAIEAPAEATPAQNARLVAIPPNTAIDLGRYACTNPAGAGGNCEAITDYSGMVYDHHHHQLLMFGGGHAQTTGTLRSDVSVFDFATLEWKSAYTPTSCADMNAGNIDKTTGAWLSTGQPMARHTYDMLVMLDDPPQMLMATSGALGPEVCSGAAVPPGLGLGTRITGYDPVSKKWAFRNTPLGEWDSYSSAEYDPVSKATMILGSNGLWAYDAKSDSFFGSQFMPAELGYANNMVYAPETERMYYFARGDKTRVYELVLDRAAWKTSTLTELVGSEGPASPETGYAHDSVNHVIGGAVVDGKFSAFDPKTKSWSTVVMKTEPAGAKIGTMAFHEIAFDPVDGVFVFITDGASGIRVWAYRYAGSPPPPPSPGSAGSGAGPGGDADGGAPTPGAGADPEASSPADAACGCRVVRGDRALGGAASLGIAAVALLGITRARRRR